MSDQRNMVTGLLPDLDGLPIEIAADHDAVTIKVGGCLGAINKAGLIQLRGMLARAELQAAQNAREACSGPCCFSVEMADTASFL